MTISEATKILEEYNHWRRAEGRYGWNGGMPGDPMPNSAKEIGEAIDVCVDALKKTLEYLSKEEGK